MSVGIDKHEQLNETDKYSKHNDEDERQCLLGDQANHNNNTSKLSNEPNSSPSKLAANNKPASKQSSGGQSPTTSPSPSPLPQQQPQQPKKTKKSNNYFSFSYWMRLFKRKDKQTTEVNDEASDYSTVTNSPDGKGVKRAGSSRNKKKTNNEDGSDKNDSALSRFVRSFSFLYKSNRRPKTSANLRRTKSVDNYRHARSSASSGNIKYVHQRPPTNNTSAASSRNSSLRANSSGRNATRVNQSGGVPRGRARSDTQQQQRNYIKRSSIEAERASEAASVARMRNEQRAKANQQQQSHVDGVGGRQLPQSMSLPKAKTSPSLKVVQANGKIPNGPKSPTPTTTLPSSSTMPEITRAESSNVYRSRRHLVTTGIDTLGVCGIQNHGNTCFINSVIQCLNNTNPFAEYFVLDHYQEDLAQLRKRGAINAELIENMTVLLKSLWSCMYSSEFSLKFKKIISRQATQYSGYAQHDAQEFLLWLLNKCHDDLVENLRGNNRTPLFGFKKKHRFYTEPIQINANSSIVYELFQGQLRSQISCKSCGNLSRTYDPYLCISVPVFIHSIYSIFVNAIGYDNRTVEVHGFSIEANGIVRELRDKISRKLKVPERRLLLLQVDKELGFVEITDDAEVIQQRFTDAETIYALETPVVAKEGPTATATTAGYNGQQFSNDMYQQMITLVWINRVGSTKECSNFGSFFTTLVSREANYKQLQSAILEAMASYLIFKDENIEELSSRLNLRIRVLNGTTSREYLRMDVQHPLFIPSVEEALLNSTTNTSRPYRGPKHLKLLVEWSPDVRQSILVTDDGFHSLKMFDRSVEITKELAMKNNSTTLEDCLNSYFCEEKLTADNAWTCTVCNTRQQCVKRLDVWSLPDILIVHLKRFRYISNTRRIKVNTMVDYPQNGLDMLKHMARRESVSSLTSTVNGTTTTTTTTNGHPAEPSIKCNTSKLLYKKFQNESLNETTYNLYGVCCHHGNMLGGHYTAFCKNPVDNCWYLYDDTKVIPVQDDAVLTSDAYILFYQKSYLTTAYADPRNINSGGGGSPPNMHHWSFSMPQFNYFNGNGGGGLTNGFKSSTLPSKKVLETNKATNGGTMKKVASNHDLNKHSNTNKMNGDVTIASNTPSSPRKPNVFSSSNEKGLTSTFPRNFKSRPPSHQLNEA